jgi:hypothetical protein
MNPVSFHTLRNGNAHPHRWLEVRGVEAILTPNRTRGVQPESQRRLILGAAAREPS